MRLIDADPIVSMALRADSPEQLDEFVKSYAAGRRFRFCTYYPSLPPSLSPSLPPSLFHCVFFRAAGRVRQEIRRFRFCTPYRFLPPFLPSIFPSL